jgi:hypothetical protein
MADMELDDLPHYTLILQYPLDLSVRGCHLQLLALDRPDPPPWTEMRKEGYFDEKILLNIM